MVGFDWALEWFLDYSGRFDLEDPRDREMVDLKRAHSLRVADEILWLARGQELEGRGLEMARILGLFHDVGRFYQYARYKTWSDLASENHARLGIRVLKEEGVLDRFSREERNLLTFSIHHHNRARAPLRGPEKTLLYARLLRDADKLDVIQVVYRRYKKVISDGARPTLDSLAHSPEISPMVMKDISANSSVRVRHIGTTTDLMVFYVGWVFDMNFDAALGAMADRGYPERLRELMPETREVETVFALAAGYLKNRLAA